MNKKIFSTFLVLALAVGVFGLISTTSVWGADDTATTATQVSNIVPSFTVGPSDNGSDGTTPTNVGSDVTFTVTATDPNADDYYLAICKSNSVTAVDSAPPTCPGGNWVITTVGNQTTSGSVETLTYTALIGDSESNDWYGFVCDHNLASICSTAGSSDHPFKVNHAGAFGTVGIEDAGAGSTIEPGETITFRLTSSGGACTGNDICDPDTDTAQDTVQMHICTDSTGFNYATDTCTGTGSEDHVCSSSAIDPTGASPANDATCSDDDGGGGELTSVPTAHGSYDFQVYVEDGHDFAATGTAGQTYTVTDVIPALSGSQYTLASTPTMVAASSVNVTQQVQMVDNNGDNDITAIDFVFNDSGTSACAYGVDEDDNDCITFQVSDPASPPAGCTIGDRSSAGSGKTVLGTDQTLTLSCDFTVWFNANDANWEINAKPTDGNGATDLGDSSSTTTIPALSAIGVTESTINYGTLSAGDDSAVQSTDMENTGNQVIDVLLDGDLMQSGGNDIPLVQQQWHHTNSSFTWGTGVTLVDIAGVATDALGCLNRSLVVRVADHTLTTWDESLYWRLRVPTQQASGTYSGSNTFTWTADGNCTDTGA